MIIKSNRSKDVERKKNFESFEYKPFSPKVSYHDSVMLIVRIGIVFPNLFNNRLLSYHYPIVFLRVVVIGFFSIIKRSAKPIENPRGKVPAIIHTGWASGYYHWLTESLPRALSLKDEHEDGTPLLPLDIYSKYLPTLKAIGFDDVLSFPEGSNVLSSRVIFTECPKEFGTTSPELLDRVRKTVKARLGILDTEANRLIYVSRAKSRGRKVANEDAVVKVIESFGGKLVFFEDLSFEGQVQLMSTCQILVGIHGAGLANMIFMPSGGTIVELLARRNGFFDYRKIGNSFKHQACYWRLAEAMGHQHEFVLGEPCIRWYNKTDMSDIIVDVDRLKSLLINCGRRLI